MPALRMKRKLNKVCQRSCCDLDCCKPMKTSEHLPSQVKTKVDTSIQIHENGYLSSIVPSGCLLGIVPSNTEESGCNTVLTRFDETSTKLLDPLPPESETTTYSPNLEHGDFLLKSTNHSDEVKRESAELPNLVSDEGEDVNCDFTGYQTCSLFNLCFPECLPFLSFDSCMRFTDVSLSQLANSDILIDLAEKYKTPPFFDSTIEANHIHDIDSIQETLLNSNDVCSYFTTHQEFGINCLSSDLGETECYSPQLVFRTSPDLPQPVSSSCPTPSPKETREGKSITLVLDLDETLVHSTTEHCDDADFTFSIFSNMKECIVYVRRRPFLQMFLERVAEMFEVVIFTASQRIYAAQLLDILDPEHKIISRRIYRESCIALDGSWIKDLTVLGIDLAKVVIIDNSPQVFRLQVNNGIPIKSWFDDPSDRALVQLLPFLETLVDAEDVRPIIAKEFGNKE